MSITTDYAVKRSNILKTGLQCLIAGIVEWAIVGRFRWYPMYIVNTIAVVLITAGILLCIITLIARIIRIKRAKLNVYNAKKYLLAFAQQYRDTHDADVANAVNAILVLRKAGILNATMEDKKLSGTVIVADEQHSVVAVEQTTTKVVNKNKQMRVKHNNNKNVNVNVHTENAKEIDAMLVNPLQTTNNAQHRRRVVRKHVD